MNFFEAIKKHMPAAINTDYGKNVNKFIQFMGEALTDAQDLFMQIEEYRNIDKASGKALDNLGEKHAQKRGQADDYFYRIMIKSKIAARRGDATVNGMIRVIQNAFGVDPQNIKIQRVEDEPLAIKVVDIPIDLARSSWEQSYLLRRIEETAAAGVRVDQIRFIDNTGTTIKVVLGTQSALIFTDK